MGKGEGGVLLGVREAWCWAVDVVRRVWKGSKGGLGSIGPGTWCWDVVEDVCCSEEVEYCW